ncbi:IclR family transcriptional regulator [Xanthobacter sp. AM11]|uniref:IclR family transcriptional regulator n=1 Tax=Xanthobacter sp. AM11 TaxID=3380643 RepID=UPI0039BEECE8
MKPNARRADPPETDETPEKEKRSGTIQSVSIAARFLAILANAEGPMPLGELARRARTGSSTAHRYMQSLVLEGLVAQDEISGRYDLGPAALSIGIGALRRISPVEVAARHMKALSMRISASCGVAIWTERGPTIVRWYRSANFSISTVGLGDVLPLDNSACGLVFQAHLMPDRIKAARRMQPPSFRGTAPAQSVLDAARQSPILELNEHLFSLLTGKAAAVFDAQNEIACVVTTVSMVAAAEAEGHRDALLEVTRLVSKDCGGTPGRG